MGAYQRGTKVNLVNKFWTVDPLTGDATLADPTTVVFKILKPDNTEQTYTFGIDVNVTNPSLGIFVCQIGPELPTGTYRYRCDGTGAVVASSEDMFDIEPSGVLTPAGPGVAQPGPCSSWINGDDVVAIGPNDLGVGQEHYLLDDVAYQASSLLYQLSGRQFPGVCSRTVRPCQDTCGCWYSPSAGMGPWWWGFASGIAPTGLWGWWNESGQQCGCGVLSTVRLSGYPVREIIEVKIGGVVLPATDAATGAPNYRLDDRGDLIRMATPGDPPTTNFWPQCQNLALDDTEGGTFSVTYTWGADVPLSGRRAAAQLARELWLATNGGKCNLPTKVTKIVRQGVTIERVTPFADFLKSGATGLQLVDAFIAEANPTKMMRRPMVYSPDQQQFAKKVGQG